MLYMINLNLLKGLYLRLVLDNWIIIVKYRVFFKESY